MQYLKTFVLLLLLEGLNAAAFGQQEKTERPGEPDIYNVNSDDKEMNNAINKSRSTFDDFTTAFDSKKTTYSRFSVKLPFATEYGVEHLWLSDISKVDGKYYGKIDNLPTAVKSIKLGQPIEIESSKISDWFYIDDGKLVGGQTIRLIRSRMSSKEKKEFDRQFGMVIE